VLFLDFFSQPFENLETSLRVLGQVTGRTGQAERFIEMRRSRLRRIVERLRGARPPRPNVFVEAHAGISEDCCNSPGKGNIGDYVELVGGHNIGADVLPGPTGRLNLEYVLSRDPDVYVATGGPHLERTGGLVLGEGYTPERARAALRAMAARRGIAELGAVRRGRTYGLSHQLLNSPLDILAVEVLAKWIHPELFADLDPGATLARINAEFLAVPLEGTYWVSLR
jgi:iron complex transport system substrate-binding protein